MTVESIHSVLSKIFVILVAITIMGIVIKRIIDKGKENAKMANAALAIDLAKVEQFISHCDVTKANEESISIMIMLLSKIPGVGKEYLQVLNSNFRRKFYVTVTWDDLEDFNEPLTKPLKL